MFKKRKQMEPELKKYRSFLISAEQKAQEQYDKTVLALSGGAFGVSFAFVNDIVGRDPQYMECLLSAWAAWGLSITAVLFSFYFSNLALRKTVMQVDATVKQVDAEEAYSSSPGGFFSKVTAVLNAIGGVLFLVGVIFLVIFVSGNTLSR